MQMSAVFLTSSLNEKYFNKSYRDNLVTFLRGILANGVLVAPKARQFARAIQKELQTVPIKYRQKVEMLFAEILKQQKRVMVSFPTETTENSEQKAATIQTAIQAQVDALVATEPKFSSYEVTDGVKFLNIEDYSISDFEETRQHFLTGNTFLDDLEPAEAEEIFIRVVKYARSLRFYDRYLGKKGGLYRFRKGIDFVLKLWQHYGAFFHSKDISAEFHTIIDNQYPDDSIKILENYLISLKYQYPVVRFKIYLKQSTREAREAFHARFLETETGILQIDRGFDFIDKKGGFVHTNLHWARSARRHLSRLRMLPDRAQIPASKVK